MPARWPKALPLSRFRKPVSSRAMLQNSSLLPLTSDQFQANFEAIAPLILEEWPSLSSDRLRATAGDLDRTVDCIAEVTDRTRVMVRRQLRELYQIAVLEPPPSPPLRLAERLTGLANGTLSESDLKQTVHLLEERTEELLKQFKREVLPELDEKVRNNVGGSLLTALGIGFILGVLFGGSRGR